MQRVQYVVRAHLAMEENNVDMVQQSAFEKMRRLVHEPTAQLLTSG